MPAFDDGLADTELPAGQATETDVLIVGSGPAGGGAALCLATLHVPNIMIPKYRWTANTPRAEITNQRAMEIFHDLGIEDQVKADATPHALVGDTVFCTSIAGEEIGRIHTWARIPRGRPTTNSRALAWSATSRRPTCSRSWSRTPPRAAPRPGSPPSTSTTPRTKTASLRRSGTGSPARCTTPARPGQARGPGRGNEFKDYEFNAHGVDLGEFYESAAIVPDGSERPQPTRDRELYRQASTVPGSHLPHDWVGDTAHKFSTLALAPYTTFTLITGIAGEA